MSVVQDDMMTAAPVAESIPRKPKRSRLLWRIRCAAGCTPPQAKAFLLWIENAVEWMRDNPHSSYFLEEWEWEDFHDILNAIAKDNAIALPGGAHEMLERYLLQPEHGEYALMHSSTVVGKFAWCTLDMWLEVVRV